MNIKLGSLFDGIGTFPLSGIKYGFTPVWASEIEPFPIRVTQHHFPDMKQLGDITKVNGAEIEPVDVITFGSPCQDMSVAGKREGLAGARSGLFMEAVRIIREMRGATGGQYPRFAAWENVPGAYSSNNGEDFWAVLEEIAESEIPMPRSGRWATAGMVRTATADIAWRTIDAQYWGVPQRRRRIFLVTDFAGQCASEILFVKEGLRGHFTESRSEGQEVTGDVGDGFEEPNCLTPWDCQSKRIYKENSKWPTLYSGEGGGAKNQAVLIKCGIIPFDTTQITSPQNGNNPKPNDPCHPLCATAHTPSVAIPINTMTVQGRPSDNGRMGSGIGKNGDPANTISAAHCHAVCTYWDGGQVSDCLDCSMLAKGQMMPEKRRFPVVIEPRSADGVCRVHEDGIVPTLNTAQGGQKQPCVVAMSSKQQSLVTSDNVANTLGANDYKEPQIIAFQPGNLNRQAGAEPSTEVFPTLGATTLGDQFPCVATFQNTGQGWWNESDVGATVRTPCGGDSVKANLVSIGYAVRRLTPLECERLQGLPDNWTNIEGASDTARYKAIGNGIAKPCSDFVLQGIARILKGDAPCRLNE